jgi:large subunit ribosomal protein L17
MAKAKVLKRFIEPLLTKSKNDTMHSRRVVFSSLKDKHAVTELFREISVKIADRPGGYTRILRTGFRQGDAAEMCIIELVDYNATYGQEKNTKKSTRTRRSKKSVESAVSKKAEKAVETQEVVTETASEAPIQEQNAE